MPCQSYEPSYDDGYELRQAKALRDRLARIACRALTKLDSLGVSIDDVETSSWWTQHKIDDAAAAKNKLVLEKAVAERKRKEREARRIAEINTLKKLQSKYGRDV